MVGSVSDMDWEGAVFSLRALAHYGVRVAAGVRVRRDTRWIVEEYNRPRRREEWRDDLSIDDLILGSTSREYVLLHDRLVWASERQVRHVLLENLRASVSRLVADNRTPTIVEVGCGTGRNLFFLAQQFPDAQLIGYELTEATVANARRRAVQFGGRVRVEQADVTSGRVLPSTFDVAYSVHALEQLGNRLDNALGEMARARRGVVFLEPCGELAPANARGLAMRLRLRNAGYLNGLYDRLVANGANIVVARRLGIGRNPLNETCHLVVDAPGAGSLTTNVE